MRILNPSWIDRRIAAQWMLWSVLAILLYYPSYRTYPFFDDIEHVQWVVAYGASFLQHPESPMFRPFERLIVGISWRMPGGGFWLAKTSSLIFLLVKTAMVASLCRTLLGRRWPLLRFAIPILYLVHPMHVASIIKIDTISENLASLFDLAVVATLAPLCMSEAPVTRATAFRISLTVAGWSILGMLSKEAYLGMAAASPLLVAIAASRPGAGRQTRSAFAISGSFTAITLALYFALRRAAGYHLVSGTAYTPARYQFHFGWNVLLNAVASFGASLFPGSTLKVFVHFDLAYIVLASSLVLVSAVLYVPECLAFLRATASGGLRTSGQLRLLWLFAAAAVASLFPGGLVNGLISENQSEATIPFVLLFVFLVPACMMEAAPSKPMQGRRAATIAILSMMAALMVSATSEKVEAAHALSVRAVAFGDAIVKRYKERPVPHFFLCVPPDSMTRDKYSIFSMSDGLLAGAQMYRLNMLYPATPTNFLPDTPDVRAQHLCSMTISDQVVSFNEPTGVTTQ